MIALVLAGGEATRLYPTTMLMPKQLIPINGKPVLKYIVDHIQSAGVDTVVVCVRDEQMATEFQNAIGEKEGILFGYSFGKGPLGTAGRVKHGLETFPAYENFVVYYGDIITDFDLGAMIQSHILNGVDCTLAVTKKKEMEFGAVSIGHSSADRGIPVNVFLEHPQLSEISNWSVNVGIAVCTSRVLKYCTPDSDFFGNVVPALLRDNRPVNAYDIESFIDIGSFPAIQKATEKLRGRRN